MKGPFTRSLRLFEDKAKGSVNQQVRKICLQLLTNLVLKSPVDTGRFRSNWRVGLGERPTTTVAIGTNAATDGLAVLNRSELGTPIYIVNNLPYAMRLEYGWSKQAPQGMARLAVASIRVN